MTDQTEAPMSEERLENAAQFLREVTESHRGALQAALRGHKKGSVFLKCDHDSSCGCVANLAICAEMLYDALPEIRRLRAENTDLTEKADTLYRKYQHEGRMRCRLQEERDGRWFRLLDAAKNGHEGGTMCLLPSGHADRCELCERVDSCEEIRERGVSDG